MCGGRHRSKTRVTWGDQGAGGKEIANIEDLIQNESFKPKSGAGQEESGLSVEEPNFRGPPALKREPGVRVTAGVPCPSLDPFNNPVVPCILTPSPKYLVIPNIIESRLYCSACTPVTLRRCLGELGAPGGGGGDVGRWEAGGRTPERRGRRSASACCLVGNSAMRRRNMRRRREM